MADLSIASTDVAGANLIDSDKLTLPAESADLAAGDMVRINTSTGKFTKANGTTAAEARVYGMLINSASKVNDGVTAVRRGLVGVGAALSALAYDADVYLSDTDGVLGTSAGTVSKVVGRVVPVFAGSGTADKVLKLEL